MKTDKILLSEYLWDYHRLNDMPMDVAERLKSEAFKHPNHITKTLKRKMNRPAPMLKPEHWEEVMDKAGVDLRKEVSHDSN